MKMTISALVAAVALVGGTAFANTASTDGTTGHRTAATSADTQHKPGLLERTKRGLHRMGDKIRSASQRKDSDDTRAMGAPAADSRMDSDRRARMDQAYDNWKSKQK